MRQEHPRWPLGVVVLLLLNSVAQADVRSRTLQTCKERRNNQLYGLGMVIGLQGTGSRSLFTQQMAVDVLQKLCVGSKIVSDVKSDNVFQSQNISVVMVTAEIGPFARTGSRLDVTVAAYDDARSLQGGMLLLTPLRAVDGEVYAVAQGALSIGGFTFSGAAAAHRKNHPTVGRIPAGAIIEKEAPGQIVCNGDLRLLLRIPITRPPPVSPWPSTIASRTAPSRSMPAQCRSASRQTGSPTWWGSSAKLACLMWFQIRRPALSSTATGTVVAGADVKISTVAIAGEPRDFDGRGAAGLAAGAVQQGPHHRSAAHQSRRGRAGRPREGGAPFRDRD